MSGAAVNPRESGWSPSGIFKPLQSASGINGQAILANVILGLAVLYVPVLMEYGGKLFFDEEDNHSGVLLALVAWSFWRDRGAFSWSSTTREMGWGAALVVTGLALYLVGRVTDSVQLLALSLPAIVTGLVMATAGARLARRWSLLSTLLVFIVPWFGPIADTLLVPLRLLLTQAAAHAAALMGFPVSTTGVFINIGFVQLNVAGACVGLRAMVSMTAIGLLFLHMFPARSRAAGVTFVLLLPCIALAANFLRVFALIITAALFGVSGEAIVHDLAAYLEVAVVLAAFLGLGIVLGPRKVSA